MRGSPWALQSLISAAPIRIPTISSLPHWDQLDPNGTHPAVLPLPHLLLHCIPRLCQPSGCPGDVCQSLSCTCCHHHSVGPLEHSLCCSLWCCGPWGAALPCLLCWWGPRAAMILQPHWHCVLPGGSSPPATLGPRVLFPALHPLLVPHLQQSHPEGVFSCGCCVASAWALQAPPPPIPMAAACTGQ